MSPLALLLAAAGTAGASPAPPPPPACAAAEHRQFDFWLGDWEVRSPRGAQLGHNRIVAGGGGCWLQEHWRSAQGNDGTSLNAWDAPDGRWRQFWVGGDGMVLRLEGGLRDGVMEMQGVLAGEHGPQRQRITWTPAADGSITQRWDVSDDDGASWRAVFVGIYRRAAREDAPAAG
jgi:hypothetical protein